MAQLPKKTMDKGKYYLSVAEIYRPRRKKECARLLGGWSLGSTRLVILQ